jgi:hypothetical protein
MIKTWPLVLKDLNKQLLRVELLMMSSHEKKHSLLTDRHTETKWRIKVVAGKRTHIGADWA